MSLSQLIKKGALRGLATATPATVATDRPCVMQSVATVAAVSVATVPDIAANDPTDPSNSKVLAKVEATSAKPHPDLDRWCWPYSSAMNTAEIDTFTARLSRFIDKGLSLADAEALADSLVKRDREMDDRRLCLECIHLHDGGTGRWRCGNAVAAGIGVHAADAQRPTDLTRLMRHCPGFTHFHSQGNTSVKPRL